MKSLSRKAFLHVDKRSGFNLLQAAVLEGKYDTFVKAHNLLSGCVREMNFKKTASNAKCFPGKTAVDILLSLSEKEKGHINIEELYKEGVEKRNSLAELHLCKSNDDAEKAVELVLNEGVDKISQQKVIVHLCCGQAYHHQVSLSRPSLILELT